MKRFFLFCVLAVLASTTLFAAHETDYCLNVYQSHLDNGGAYKFYFEQKEVGRDEYVIRDFVVPGKYGDNWPMFWVGYNNSFYSTDLGNNHAKSANQSFASIPLSANRQTKLGLAEGAIGTMHIFNNSTDDNLYIQFSPAGYAMAYGAEHEDWTILPMHEVGNHLWETDVVVVTNPMKYTVAGGYSCYVGFLGDRNQAVYSESGRSETFFMGSMGSYSETWDNGVKGHWGDNLNTYAVGRRGYFQMWDNSVAQNWAVHFVPVWHVQTKSVWENGYEEVLDERDVVCGDAYTLPADPVHTPHYCTFGGWYLDEACTQRIDAATYTPTGDVTIYAKWTRQQLGQYQFEHSHGKSGRPFIRVNGYDMQDVHTYERTIYMAPNEQQRLYRPDYLTYFRFIRWYDYNKDGTADNLSFSTPTSCLRAYADAFGQFYNRIQNQSEAATFTAPANFTAANFPHGVTIACDQSAYSDAPLRLIATTGESALSGLFWYFYEVDHSSDVTLLTAAQIESMEVGGEKTIVIASPATNSEGYVLLFNGTIYQGYTNRSNTQDNLLALAKLATTYDNGSGRFTLRREASGYTIRSVKNENFFLGIDNTAHAQGFRSTWTDAQKTLSIVGKTEDISSYVNHNYLTTGDDAARLTVKKGEDYLVSNGGFAYFVGSTQWVHEAKAATRHEVYYLVEDNKQKLTAEALNALSVGASKTVLWSHPAALPEGYVAVCNGEGQLHGWDYSPNPDEAFVNASIDWRLGGGKTNSLLFTFTKTAAGDFTVSSTPYQGGATYYLYLDARGQAMFTTDAAQAGHFSVESYGYDMSDQRMPSLSALSRYGVLLRSNGQYLSSTANVPNTGRTMAVSTSTISLQSIVTNAGANAYSSVEPTLSQRLLFHILPADMMATDLTDKDAPIQATINEKYLYWAIRKQSEGNNFPILRQSDLAALGNGSYTIQLISPLSLSGTESGYALAHNNQCQTASLSNRNWGTIAHLVTHSDWFTSGTPWDDTKLTLTKSGSTYTISKDGYYLVFNAQGQTWTTNAGAATTFSITSPSEPITIDQHEGSTTGDNYLFRLTANGYALYSGGACGNTSAVATSSATTKDEWLEERTILAPTGQTIYIGPSLQYTSAGAGNLPYYTHTYYLNLSNGLAPCIGDAGNTKNGTWQWQRDGANYTPNSVMTGRFAEIAPESTPGVHTYTLTFTPTGSAVRYNVFRAYVDVRDKAAIGPSTTLDYDAVKNAEKIGEETFNYNMPGTTDFVAYTQPVPFNESSYGFYYGTNDHYSNGGGEGALRTFPYWGEYGILNQALKSWGIGYDIANHDESHGLGGTDASRGYMLYTDGSEIPGDLFSLRVQDLHLCAGSKMYCSAWVASVTNAGATPVNLDFEVTAISNDDQQSVLTTYTTGDITLGGVWQHIVFPVTYSAELGDITNVREFRVRVINKGKDAKGNDFAIDDISFWAKKPTVLPIQASATSCISSGSTETIPTYLRIDYEQLVAEEGNVTYYYRWYDAGYHTKEAAYFGETRADDNYGTVLLQRTPDGEHGRKFENYKEFDDYINADNHGETAGVYYVKERAEDGENRYFLYVVQPLKITANKTYRVAIAAAPGDLDNPQANRCAILESINMIGGARIRVDGSVATDAITPCGNQLYTLDVEMAYLVHNEGTGTYDEHSYSCSADWLLGDETYIDANQSTYTATYDDIYTAILSYRNRGTGSGEPTPEQVALIEHLVQEGLLTINQPRITTYPNANAAISTLHYTAFPRGGSSHGEPAVCEQPQVVTFHLPDDAQRNGVALGQEALLPNQVAANPRNVRMTEGTEEVSFPIRVLGTLKGYVLTHAQRYETNAKGEKENHEIVPLRLTDMSHAEVPAVVGNSLVTLYGETLKHLPVGRHTFYIEMTVPEKDDQGHDVSDCEITYAYFTLIVQPKVLTWLPSKTTDGAAVGAWNNDANWQEGIAPIASSQVILPAAALTVPEAVSAVYDGEHRTATQSASVETGAQSYITYDINYQPFACHDIYLPDSVSLLYQTRLSIGGIAYVDMPFEHGKWQLTSFPIHGVVSGDMFIPQTESTLPFEVAQIAQPADRFLHPFYHNLYNASVTNTVGSGSCQETITSSTWLSNTELTGESGNTANGVSLSYDPVSGYNAVALWLDDTSNGVVRLPKSDTEYKFYDKTTHQWIDYLTETITRDANSGKPVYTGVTVDGDGVVFDGQTFTLRGNASSNWFLLGNPTFAYLDVQAFMEVNADEQSGTLTGAAYSYKGDKYVAQVNDISANGVKHYLLPPYSAMMVNAREKGTSVDVTITDAMLTSAPSASTAPARSSSSFSSSSIYIAAESGNFTSYALAEEAVGDNAYVEGEDAPVFLMAANQTPFAVYTTVGNEAMAINRHSNLDYLPLCLFSQEEALQGQKQTTYLTFTGDDTYLREWDLLVLGTTVKRTLYNGYRVKVAMPTDGTASLALSHTRRPMPTGTDGVEQHADVRKVLIGNQIVIIRGGEMYYVNGQKAEMLNY